MENNDHNVLYIYLVGGLEHDWIIFHILEIIIPNWRSPSFFRGVGIWNHQPDILLTVINHIITIDINHILIVYYQPMVGWNLLPVMGY
jgi:hypothetical protein